MGYWTMDVFIFYILVLKVGLICVNDAFLSSVFVHLQFNVHSSKIL